MAISKDNFPDESAVDCEPTPSEQAALGWVVCCDRGLGAEQEREFARWLEADARHRELFKEFGGTWAVMGRINEAHKAIPARAASPADQVSPFDASSASRGARRHGPWTIWAPLAAAVAIALAYFGSTRPEPGGAPVATEIGVTRQLKPADGSVITLNTDSSVVTAFTPAERRVRLLKGEAFFEVAKDPCRPFIVEAAGVAVRAVGTAFNVRVQAESVDVIVTEGKVRVASGCIFGASRANSSVLSSANGPATSSSATNPASEPMVTAEVGAGERLLVPLGTSVTPTTTHSPGVARVPVDEVQRLLAWQSGRLDFYDTPLGKMVAEFNRYNRHQLSIVDAEVAAMRFGGSFRPDDRVGFVRMLRENFGIRAEERENLTLLRAAR